MTGDLHDEIRDRIKRRQLNPRIIGDLLKDPNFKHLSPEVLDGIIAAVRAEEPPKTTKKKETADQAALEHVRVLLSSSTWWATAAYGVARERCEFFEWIGACWEHRTVQQIVSVMNIPDESMDFKNKCLGYLSTLAQVQGPAERDQLGFRLAVSNGVLDFQDGAFRPARPEDRLRTTLGRRYLLPHERMDRTQNRFFLVLGAYVPAVQRIVLGALLPRMVAPWPGCKIFYLVGPAGTGKSKLISLLVRLLDGATASIHADRLLKSQFQSKRLDGVLVNLTAESKRSEIKEAQEWKEDGDRLYIEVEEKGGDLYQVRFMVTTVRACNLLPFLPALGSEFWRRLFPIPFVKRLKGTSAGVEDIERTIRELTPMELDSVYSEAVDVAISCGPEGTYPGDLDDDAVESLYMDLVDGLRLFMQSKLKWSDSGEYVLLSDIVDAYRGSDYSLTDRDKGRRDERGTYTLFETARAIGVTMGGRSGKVKVAHGDGPQALFGLVWAAADRGQASILGAFTVDEGSDCSEENLFRNNLRGEKPISGEAFPFNMPFSLPATQEGKRVCDNQDTLSYTRSFAEKRPIEGETPYTSRENIPLNISEVASNPNDSTDDDGGYPPSSWEE